MTISNHSHNTTILLTALLAIAWGFSNESLGQRVVPGTGKPLTEVGDNFEDPDWGYDLKLPKVYNHKEDTLSTNSPGGQSKNGRWYEGSKRGQPDFIHRVSTPLGGLPGSTGALAISSIKTGSSQPSYQQQQDDFIANVAPRVGKLSASRSPSVVTRVWMPPVDEWENRTGCHFAFRVAVETDYKVPRKTFFNRNSEETSDMWPGMFLHFDSKEGKGATRKENDSAHFWFKASTNGMQIRGPQVTSTGWWTLGISMTPDGKVHYYAKPGIEDLTEADHVASAYPFGRRSLRMRNFFFNACSGDDGKTESTEFIVDDPTVFVLR
ncbi:MAG: hypothetical protein MK106_10295 [Mariniblastus sp.]|nr:hypothetical protein [Mariniblastus sp.]